MYAQIHKEAHTQTRTIAQTCFLCCWM